jgi:regulator of sigma E protease
MSLGVSLLAFVVVLIPLIVIHEFGHLLACKMVGISVLEFGIGFPPRALKLFQWGETEFTLNWIPLGGFVMPYGEDFMKPEGEAAMEAKREAYIQKTGQERKLTSVYSAKPWQKIWYLSAGALANLVAALALFIILPLTGIPTQRADVMVDAVLTGTTTSNSLQRGDQILEVNGEEVQSGLEVEFLLRQDYTLIDALNMAIGVTPENRTPVVLTVQRGDETLDVDVVPQAPRGREYIRISGVQEGSPAEDVGLETNDRILKAAGEEFTSLERLQKITDDYYNRELPLLIERNGEEQEINVVPQKLDQEDQPARIGILIQIEKSAPSYGFLLEDANIENYTERLSLADSVEYGVDRMRFTVNELIGFPAAIIRGEISAEEARPVSPVGVAQMGGQIIEDRPYQDLVMFTALISIALAVTNLLPIPALDGGRILFVLIEIIRGRPMEPEREGLVHFVGFAFLLILVAITVINDIANPVILPQ